jgi:hypothetical protein
MKTTQWIGAVVAFLLILSGCSTNNRGVVESPAFIDRSWSAGGLEIMKVELNDTVTVLYMKAFEGYWVRIASGSFLTDNLGNQYNILSTEGITMDEKFYMPESGEAEFAMIFPPVASNAVSVDFSEGDVESALKIWGIQLTNKPLKVHLPKGFKEATIDKNAVLPPVELKAGKARFEGEILNYRPGMPAEVEIRIVYPFAYPGEDITFQIDENGKFSGEINAFSVHPVSLYWSASEIKCFIAPGETTSIILNPAEMSRRESRLLVDKPSLGEPVYYGGYLASLAKELTGVRSDFSLELWDSRESFNLFLQVMGIKTPEEIKSFFWDKYQAKKAGLDALDVSPACKQTLLCASDLFYASFIANTAFWINQGKQLLNNGETAQVDLPDDFYNILKEFPLLNAPQVLYTEETAMCLLDWKLKNSQPIFSKALGTDQGIIFDLLKVTGMNFDIKNSKPVDEAQIAQLPAVFQEFIRTKNEKLLQQLLGSE